MAMRTRDRLAAFKSATGPYARPLPTVERVEEADRDAERKRQARAAIGARIAEDERLRAERKHHVAEHRAATRRLKQAARALPCVYGTPPGTEAVKAAVRRAKDLCRSMPPLEALETCAEDCALMDIVDAVLQMRGAPS